MKKYIKEIIPYHPTFSVRLMNALENNLPIEGNGNDYNLTIENVCKKTENEIIRFKNIGRKCLRYLQQCLEANGFSLAGGHSSLENADLKDPHICSICGNICLVKIMARKIKNWPDHHEFTLSVKVIDSLLKHIAQANKKHATIKHDFNHMILNYYQKEHSI